MIIKGLAGQLLPVYGDGENIRDWLYVEDHARALALVVDAGRSGETYNVGGARADQYRCGREICDLLDELPASHRLRERVSLPSLPTGLVTTAATPSIASKLERELGWRAGDLRDRTCQDGALVS